MIYYQNGMDNSELESKEGAAYLGRKLGLKEGEVGVFSNKTQGRVADFKEYCAPLGMKDVLNAYEYERISKMSGPEERHLIVAFSAGNEDAYKAMQVLNLENRNLGGNIDFISVGSPRGKKDLEGMAEKVGGNVIGQYNNWKDPTTHPKTWVAGTVGLGLVGLGVGVSVAPVITSFVSEGLSLWSGSNVAASSAAVSGGGMGYFFTKASEIATKVGVGVAKVGVGVGVVGLGAGGVKGATDVGTSLLTKYHTFKTYLDRNEKEIGGKTGGLVDTIKDWKERNIKK